MAKYLITEKAGRFVAGHRNTGVGTILELLPHAAEYELTLGTLVEAAAEPVPAEPQAEQVVAEEPDGTEQASEEQVSPKKKQR